MIEDDCACAGPSVRLIARPVRIAVGVEDFSGSVRRDENPKPNSAKDVSHQMLERLPIARGRVEFKFAEEGHGCGDVRDGPRGEVGERSQYTPIRNSRHRNPDLLADQPALSVERMTERQGSVHGLAVQNVGGGENTFSICGM